MLAINLNHSEFPKINVESMYSCWIACFQSFGKSSEYFEIKVQLVQRFFNDSSYLNVQNSLILWNHSKISPIKEQFGVAQLECLQWFGSVQCSLKSMYMSFRVAGMPLILWNHSKLFWIKEQFGVVEQLQCLQWLESVQYSVKSMCMSFRVARMPLILWSHSNLSSIKEQLM